MKSITPHFVSKPWGGEYIARAFDVGLPQIGEAWLLSTLTEGESRVDDLPLSQFLGEKLPYLIKIIDAEEPLSVQVHPDDAWANKLEHSKGKTECWLIIDARPGAGVYVGLEDTVTEAQLREAITQNSAVDRLMKFHPVQKGDFISVPAGTIHAIGGGVTLLEVQQASGITYRIWDWGRTGRELHVDKSLKVANFAAQYGVLFNIFDDERSRSLLKHSDFECYYNESHGTGWFVDLMSFDVYSGDKALSEPFIFVRSPESRPQPHSPKA